MSLENENKADARRKSEQADGGSKGRKGAKGKSRQSPEVGVALRAIYQHTIDEDVPSEMLSLLGKLD